MSLVYQIKGDTVEILFNPLMEKLRVGQNLFLKEITSQEGLLVQVIELGTFSYPGMAEELIRRLVESSFSPPGGIVRIYEDLGPVSTESLEIAYAKIRKKINNQGQLEPWDGWIPTRNLEISGVADEKIYKQCIPNYGNPISLGVSLSGDSLTIDGRCLEKVNLITSAKGAGKSHLAKVILLQLIKSRMPCLVFDINREYIKLPGVKILSPGQNFFLGVADFGVEPLTILLQRYGLHTETSLRAFESTLLRRLEEIKTRPEFLTIEGLITMANSGQFYPGPTEAARSVNNAIKVRLQYIQRLGIFAEQRDKAKSIITELEVISENGGALIIDLAVLPTLAREGFVHAILDSIKQFCKREGTKKFPFVFFEEAHTYVSKAGINDIVTRARHLGITSFFITNMPTDLDEVVLRQVDNLFLLYLPHEGDIKHVSKIAFIDEATIEGFARRLTLGQALLIGEATRKYPIIFQVDPLTGIDVAGETRYSFPINEGA